MDYNRLVEGRLAVVTGGAGQIGSDTVRLLAQHGAKVAFADCDEAAGKALEREIAKVSPGSFFFPCDLATKQGVDAFAAQVLEKLGGVDILVNCAGVFLPALLHETTDEDFEAMLDLNLRSVVRVTRKLIPSMMQRRRGAIVNVTSDYAVTGVPGVSAYAATKGAVHSFTRALAMDYAKYGIRANTVMPGVNIGGMGDKIIEEIGQEAAAERFRLTQLIPRRGTPMEVANTILYLASDMSLFVLGEAIPADGGAMVIAHKQSYTGTWRPIPVPMPVR